MKLSSFCATLMCVMITACTGQGGAVSELVVKDAAPRVGADGLTAEAIGLESIGGVFEPLLDMGCALPCQSARTFTTAADDQSEILVRLYRGTGQLVADAELVADLRVRGFPQAPRGETQLQLTVTARDGDLMLRAVERQSGIDCEIARAGN